MKHCLSYGESSTVCFERYADGSQHGNFLPSTYKAILKNPAWRRRLGKVHTLGLKSFPEVKTGAGGNLTPAPVLTRH